MKRILIAIALLLSLAMVVPIAFADPAHCKVTGGGWIIPADGGDKATFGFNAMGYVTGQTPNPPVKGDLEYVDHNTGMKVHGDVNILVIIYYQPYQPNQNAKIQGTCRVTGIAAPFDGWFTLYVTDNGEPGTSDTFHLYVFTDAAMTQLFYNSGELPANQVLGGGNIQTHPLPAPQQV